LFADRRIIMRIPKGFYMAGMNCGIKKDKPDIGIIIAEDMAVAAGVFTKSVNVAYPVTISKKHIVNPIKAILANSGNANCFWGETKNCIKENMVILDSVAELTGVEASNILMASTGMIGKPLPKQTVLEQLPLLVEKAYALHPVAITDFADSIMTTDTGNKIAYTKVKVKNGEINVLGIAKGVGMIKPDMATMLGFILIDAKLTKMKLKSILTDAVEDSFNSISVDGCMSTNDTVFLLSSNKISIAKDEENKIKTAVNEVCLILAKKLIEDSEGAQKFITVSVKGAKTKAIAKKAAMAVACSDLVKTAIHGQQNNWGRIVAALGQAGIKVSGPDDIKISGLTTKDVLIEVDLHNGADSKLVYTCDLTKEYIAINANYN
ncbi:MAG: bifunctional ornithine acetyltransferase/N-acetylglutamate synthase, partial [Candidatus Omnitrophota bacterium]